MDSIMIYELLTRQTYLTTWKTDKAENEKDFGQICEERTRSNHHTVRSSCFDSDSSSLVSVNFV